MNQRQANSIPFMLNCNRNRKDNLHDHRLSCVNPLQKQPPRGVPGKRCSENMHQTYRRTSNFIEIALRHVCSPVNLLHIFRTPFSRITSRWLLLKSIVLLYYSIFKVMSNGSLNLRHQSDCTNILRKSHRIVRNVFS